MTLPFNDSDLTYDFEYHRYIPTIGFIKRKTGIDLKNGDVLNAVDDSDPSTLGARTLDDLSDHLYREIYKRTPNGNRYFLEYILATDEEARIRLKRAFINEIKYVLRNGDFWLSIGDYQDKKAISPDTLNLFMEDLPCGYNILYAGVYPVPIGVRWREDY